MQVIRYERSETTFCLQRRLLYFPIVLRNFVGIRAKQLFKYLRGKLESKY